MSDGFRIFAHDAGVARWAEQAARVARRRARDPARRAANLRHGKTWFVGLDLLPNDADGALDGVPLPGDWRDAVPDLPLHAAQVSIVYPGYPGRDPEESLASHRFRVRRRAAHVDGLLPIGPERRRFAHEYHAYILSIPLNEARAAPTVVWRGSHEIMQRALRGAIGGAEIGMVDVTQAYQDARRTVFETCEMVPLDMAPGDVALIHRFALHGTDPWQDRGGRIGPDGRMVAFFRPEFSAEEWLHGD